MNERFLTRSAVRQVDQRAVEVYAMSSLVLMENAGRGCADVLCQQGIRGSVAICCGKGNNGGDGLVLARHLDLRGFAVELLMWSDRESMSCDSAANLRIAERSGLAIQAALEMSDAQLQSRLRAADWIVDALLGTGVRGDPRAPFDAAICFINGARATGQPPRVLAVDVPSGLDCDTGRPAATTVRADHTCTFVAQKTGFRAAQAAPYLGQIHVLDIGAPRKLLEELGGDE